MSVSGLRTGPYSLRPFTARAFKVCTQYYNCARRPFPTAPVRRLLFYDAFGTRGIKKTPSKTRTQQRRASFIASLSSATFPFRSPRTDPDRWRRQCLGLAIRDPGSDSGLFGRHSSAGS